MTPQEIQESLKLISLPKSYKLSAWEHIEDVNYFLRVQFGIVEQAGESYQKNPAWERLVRFYESVSHTL